MAKKEKEVLPVSKYQQMLVDGHIVEYTTAEDLEINKIIRSKIPYEAVDVKNVYDLMFKSVDGHQVMSRAMRTANVSYSPDFQPLYFADLIENRLSVFETGEEDLEKLAKMTILTLRKVGCLLPKLKLIYNSMVKTEPVKESA